MGYKSRPEGWTGFGCFRQCENRDIKCGNCVRFSEFKGEAPIYDEVKKEESKETVHVNTEEWVKGTWENIDKEPINIESFDHLKYECNKRGVIPKAFCKPLPGGRWGWSK